MEKTFLMVKPDGVQRNVIGEIVARFEKKGYHLAGAKLMQIPTELAEEHYGEHKERPFFGELVDFITSGGEYAWLALLISFRPTKPLLPMLRAMGMRRSPAS
jgi:nucleoside-diphosphate kinase